MQQSKTITEFFTLQDDGPVQLPLGQPVIRRASQFSMTMHVTLEKDSLTGGITTRNSRLAAKKNLYPDSCHLRSKVETWEGYNTHAQKKGANRNCRGGT